MNTNFRAGARIRRKTTNKIGFIACVAHHSIYTSQDILWAEWVDGSRTNISRDQADEYWEVLYTPPKDKWVVGTRIKRKSCNWRGVIDREDAIGTLYAEWDNGEKTNVHRSMANEFWLVDEPEAEKPPSKYPVGTRVRSHQTTYDMMGTVVESPKTYIKWDSGSTLGYTDENVEKHVRLASDLPNMFEVGAKVRDRFTGDSDGSCAMRTGTVERVFQYDGDRPENRAIIVKWDDGQCDYSINGASALRWLETFVE